LIVKLDSDGTIEWERGYGFEDRNRVPLSIQETGDAGYIIAGGHDLLKLDSEGNVEWDKGYGDGFPHSVQQTTDRGYVAAGSVSSSGLDSSNFWVLKTDEDGNVQWEKSYGGHQLDEANSVKQTPDGGYIVTGRSDSSGLGDALVLKLDSEGNVEWQNWYGTDSFDEAWYVQLASDGGYVLAGRYAGGQAWLVKLDSEGAVEWERAYGGPKFEEARSVEQTPDGGYLITSWSNSFTTDGFGNTAWIIKVDSEGRLENCLYDVVTEADSSPRESTVKTADTSVKVTEPRTTLIKTKSQAADTDAAIQSQCGPGMDFTLNLSALTLDEGQEVHAIANTNDPTVKEVTFRWIDANGQIASEETIPILVPDSVAEDSFGPDSPGDWAVEADFGIGKISKPLIVSSSQLAESKIVFVSDRDGNDEIYMMDADGENQHRLTNDASSDMYPSWSPDGSKIAFASNRDGDYEIYVMNADGSNLAQLTRNYAEDLYPSWSFDGRMLAFSSDRDGNSEIYVMNEDGTQQSRLTETEEWNWDSDPSWSPDGRKLVYTCVGDQLCTIDSDGSDPTILLDDCSEGNGDTGADWSPDGKRITFSSSREKGGYCDNDGSGEPDIYVVNSDGSAVVRISEYDYVGPSDQEPSWSPDGTKVVFSTARDDNYEIYVISRVGTMPERITNNSYSDKQPDWGPLSELDGPDPRCSEATIVGTEDSDNINGTPGADIIDGGGGNDIIYGLTGDDIICGGSGEDEIYGGAGDDSIFGGHGKDKISGGKGDDEINGGAGDDAVDGNGGNDSLYGSSENDTLNGMDGIDNNDSLDGGAGLDTCNSNPDAEVSCEI